MLSREGEIGLLLLGVVFFCVGVTDTLLTTSTFANGNLRKNTTKKESYACPRLILVLNLFQCHKSAPLVGVAVTKIEEFVKKASFYGPPLGCLAGHRER